MKRTFITISLALLVCSSPAAAADCEAPSWFRLVNLRKKSDEIAAAAFGKDPTSAWIAAKRKIAAAYLEKYQTEVFALPQIRGQLNTKVYTQKDYEKILPQAVAYRMPNPKRIEYEYKCERHYIALLASVKAITAELKSQQELAEDINTALTGNIDALEQVTFQKQVTSTSNETASIENALREIVETSRRLNKDDMIDRELMELLRLHAKDLRLAIDEVSRLTFNDDRAREAGKLHGKVVTAGAIMTGVRDYKAKDFASASQVFQKCAHSGEVICHFMVGMMHLRAQGVRRDHAEALRWLRRSAGSGHTISKLFVGIYTFSGIGTKSDPETAGKWISEAMRDGWVCDIEVKSCEKRN